jgi:uncharacterized protein YegL
MKKGLTEIVAILDKSGSMEGTRSDALGGINSFIEEQKLVPGDANFTLTLFDTQVISKYNGTPIQNVSTLAPADYVPGGMTALLDAIGNTIAEVETRINSTPDVDKPEKVIVAILTDGAENSSKEYNREQIFEKINTQKTTYNWEFLFLGANQDAISTGNSIGIDHNSNYVADSMGTSSAYINLSASIRSYRTTGSVDDSK